MWLRNQSKIRYRIFQSRNEAVAGKYPSLLFAWLNYLGAEPPHELGAVFVESTWKAARRPYHKQKLALLLANQRHFALELARRGVA